MGVTHCQVILLNPVQNSKWLLKSVKCCFNAHVCCSCIFRQQLYTIENTQSSACGCMHVTFIFGTFIHPISRFFLPIFFIKSHFLLDKGTKRVVSEPVHGRLCFAIVISRPPQCPVIDRWLEKKGTTVFVCDAADTLMFKIGI